MNVAVFIAPGFEEIEAFTVVDYLRRAEQNVTVVSVPEDGCPVISSVVEGSHGIKVVADVLLKDFINNDSSKNIDAIYFPGGMPGAKNLSDNQFLFELITEFESKGKLVAAMCASPAVVLAHTGILANRKWTCYPGMEDEVLKWCGGDTKAKELLENSTHKKGLPFVLDNNVLTGRGPGTAEQFSMKFVEIAAGRQIADKIHESTCQR
ncbi:DJ-1 family glyoxalase III [Treponema pectinovorum]|uniref:DJ-1 family glyoxalase III n=1 Tax=Treponema pectinovorum TaxID=164 RepID=UPI0011C8B3EB|nr:DJ-1 family glyoxalase III [Treponema pectinovorum]